MSGPNKKPCLIFIWAPSTNRWHSFYWTRLFVLVMFPNMSNYDKAQWQAEQAARDAAMDIQKAKWAKAKERAARNAQRKLDRLARKLSEDGNLSDWEEEFAGSVTERLDKFGSAFQDPQKAALQTPYLLLKKKWSPRSIKKSKI